jgi:chaperonin GroEL
VREFEILRRIGRGGMGTVFLARSDPPFERLVALKELNLGEDDPRAATRFLNEAKIAVELRHGNVVPVYDHFEEGGVPYISMQYNERGSLAPLAQRLTLAQSILVLQGIFAALAEAERHRIVHRDLKPANILITAAGQVQVGDFGLAKALLETRMHHSTTRMVGTPAYMAPEQVEGVESERSDLYSTGVMAYEMLVGRLPFEASHEWAIVKAHMDDDPPDPCELRPELDGRYRDWLLRLLAKKPADRPSGATDAWEELETITVDVLGAFWHRQARLTDDVAPASPVLHETEGGAAVPVLMPRMVTVDRPTPQEPPPSPAPTSSTSQSRVAPGHQLRRSVAQGVSEVADAVRSTYGPRGRFVVIGAERRRTRRADEIAREIVVDGDLAVQEGVDLARGLAEHMRTMAGDGGTTAIILAQDLVNGVVDAEGDGRARQRVLNGIRRALDLAIDGIREHAVEIDSKAKIQRVATIAAGDDEIGDVIADAIEKVGKDGVVNVEEGQTFGMDLEFTEGMRFDRGYVSPYMVTDQERMEAVLHDPYVLLVGQRVASVRDLLPVLEQVIQTGKPLLVIAHEVDGEALATLIVNKLRGTFTSIGVNTPGFGERRDRTLEDIAILTGGEVVSVEWGLKLENTQVSQLGRARRVVVTKDTTTIVDGAGDVDGIKDRINQIKTEIENTDSDFDREKLQERLAKLSGGVAVVKVGAATETEMKEKKHRVEDALQAVYASIEEGIVPGGAVTLHAAAAAIGRVDMPDSDAALGADLVAQALRGPLRQLAENAGFPLDSAALDSPVRRTGEYLDVVTGEYSDLIVHGVIDTAFTLRLALQEAVSLAETVAGTERVLPARERPSPTPPPELAALADTSPPSAGEKSG